MQHQADNPGINWEAVERDGCHSNLNYTVCIELTMSAFFVTKDGEELTHAQMTQQLMQRVTELEDSNKRLLQDQILNLVERLQLS